MSAAKTKGPDELRMSEHEFDRIMRKALQVKPEGAKTKRSKKPKPAAKKKAAKR